MLKKWVSVQAELGGALLVLAGKLDYPFDKSLGGGKDEFARFECLLVKEDGLWKPFSRDLPGASGHVSIRRERIVLFIPLRESSEYWEGVWRGLLPS